MKVLVQIITNDFYDSRVSFQVFMEKDCRLGFKKSIYRILGLYNSTSDGKLMGDKSLFGSNCYTIKITDIGNSDIETISIIEAEEN